MEEDGRHCTIPLLRENFVERVFALRGHNALRARGLTRRSLLAFSQPLQAATAGS
ncbi:hypothetical protein MJK72_03880 [Klebsiella pneumoniae]|nr:hypothetical protein MJK72_03880 [Klebsiella pneumoniae]